MTETDDDASGMLAVVDDTSRQRICAEAGCTTPLLATDHHLARYCPEHKRPKRGPGGKRVKKDKAPGSVNFNMPKPSTKKDDELDRVHQRVVSLLGTITVGLAMIGQADDAADIAKGAESLASAIRELAKHEEWLKKLASVGGGSPDRMMAWVATLMALAAILIPILHRHKLVTEKIASMFSILPDDLIHIPDSDDAQDQAA